MSALVEVRVGLGSCGVASGAEPVRDALLAEARAAGLPDAIKAVGCNGMCHREPIVEVVHPDGTTALYGNVTPAGAKAIARAHLRPSSVSLRLRWAAEDVAARVGHRDAQAEDATPLNRTSGPAAAYLAKQKRIVLENCGDIDPLDIDAYCARGGYSALERAIRESTPQEIIAAIEQSGLRGRGGAGFPTGRKWAIAGAATGGAAPAAGAERGGRAVPRDGADPAAGAGAPRRVRLQPDPGEARGTSSEEREAVQKYVICNGDEGDPGAFMDRLVLESDPHRVVEGLAIAAYAIGATAGFFYIRAEYPLAVRRVRRALEQARTRGYIGPSVCGSGFSLELEVREGAGAFVCGEETALILSLEGQRGMPRLRPPYPAERGYRNRPTLINNVETLACVPWILRHGPQAFASLGTATSKGTKVFALAGKINHGGLIEVPMGITIREIVEHVGGGIKNGRRFKAVQMGGPSGGCIPAALADTPIDYDALTRTGAIMGSGGLVVLDDRDCMVDMARFFLRFTQAESCGKCTFCRIGTKRMLEILDRLCEGHGRRGDLDTLATLSDYVSRASLCGLGQTAPNPVLTTLRYFRNEYDAHLHEHRCPAGRCAALIEYRVTDACIGCTLCAQACPVAAIAPRPYEKHEIDTARCTRCDMCVQVCRDNAIEVI